MSKETGEMPTLGYLSLNQLQEHAIAADPDGNATRARYLASRTFLATMRLNAPFVEAEVLDPEADHNTFGWPKLIDVDALQQMVDNGTLTTPRPSTSPYFPDIMVPTNIGEKGERLMADYVEGRVHFLDR